MNSILLQRRQVGRETNMRRILSCVTIMFAFCYVTTAFAVEPKTAVATVRDFYQEYLAYSFAKTPKAPRPAIAWSKAFFAEITKTATLCRKYGEGPCGWGADGDEYLDAQEIDPALSYANSRITISEISPGTVQVKLNVYPSIEDAGDYYQRSITYKMVKENGAYAVDDIAYTDRVSIRKKLSEERKQLIAYPRSDAAKK